MVLPLYLVHAVCSVASRNFFEKHLSTSIQRHFLYNREHRWMVAQAGNLFHRTGRKPAVTATITKRKSTSATTTLKGLFSLRRKYFQE